MNEPQLYRTQHAWWLAGLVAFILFARLGAAPIYILDEAKNAQCAREMLLRNDWVVPTFNGTLRTDKPVLHYYFMMLAYKLFGINEFAARFFSALLGVCTLLVSYFFTKRFINRFSAFCCMVVLASSTHFLFEFRLSVPDPYLIFFTTLALFTSFTYLEQNKTGHLFIAAICFALATLAKGPVALALPGLCLLTWVSLKKKWKPVLNWQVLPAILLIAAITLPWYVAVHKATNGAWTRGFFVEHNLNRFSDPQEGHGGFFLVTLIFVLVGLLPFSAFLGETAKRKKMVFAPPLVQFSGIVVLAFVVFFSIASTRLPNYPMPCYPFAAIIIGHYLSLALAGDEIKKYPVYIVMAILALLPFAGFVAIMYEEAAAYVSWISFLLLIGPLSLAYLLYRWKKLFSYTRLLYLVAGYSLFNIMLLHVVYPVLYWQNPVAKTLPLLPANAKMYAFQIYNPGFNFYLPYNIKTYNQIDDLKRVLEDNPGAFVISRAVYTDSLKTLNIKEIARFHDLFETPTTVVYAKQNQP